VREKFPDAHITLVVAAGSAELLPAISGVDRTFIARGQIRDAAAWFTVARRRFDYCVDFTHSDRSAFLTVLSRARKRVTSGHARLQSKLRALGYNELVDCSLRLSHTVDYNLALLEPLGIRDASPKVQLHLPPSPVEQAQKVLERENVKGEFLLLHPGSARIEKFWEAERWADVLKFAAERQLPCVLTGGNSPLEQNHIKEIRRYARHPFIDVSGKISLLTLAALIQRARLVTTVDSAPVHLASAMQTPQVVLFGPTNSLHWRPRFTPALILQAGNPEPLTEFAPNRKAVAMNQISTAQVIDAMKALLAAPPAASA
jgi:ADP-heptose:LPS heptosyltransferase